MRLNKTTILSVVAFFLGVGVAALVFRSGADPQAGAASPPEIIFYSEPNFEGHELRINDDTVDLPFEDLVDGTRVLWNDNIGSIVVMSGTWRVFQHGRWNTAIDNTPREQLNLAEKQCVPGWSSVLSATSYGPLRISSLELAGLGRDISSVQLVSVENLPDWLHAAR